MDAFEFVGALVAGILILLGLGLCLSKIFTNLDYIREIRFNNKLGWKSYARADEAIEHVKEEMTFIDLALEQHPDLSTEKVKSLHTEVLQGVEESIPARRDQLYRLMNAPLPTFFVRSDQDQQAIEWTGREIWHAKDSLDRQINETVSQFHALQNMCRYDQLKSPGA